MAMTRRDIGLLLAVIFGGLGAIWQANAQEKDPKADPAQPSQLTQALGGEERYLTHISTDKPIYKPGETVYARGVMLHQLTGKPQPQAVTGSIEVVGPKGDVIAAGNAQSEDAVLAFGWKIPEEMPGGEYKVKFSHPWTGDSPAERKFDIRAYRAPRLRSQIKFLRDGYGPTDEVVATLNVTRAEGGVPAGAKVQVVARVDGAEAYRGETKVDEYGRCVTRFKLARRNRPRRRDAGDGDRRRRRGGNRQQDDSHPAADGRSDDVSRRWRSGRWRAESRLLRGLHASEEAGRSGRRNC